MIRKSLFAFITALPTLYSCHQSNEVEIAVCCINDFHASFVADTDRGIHGVESLIHTLDSIKSIYPNHVVISAGDNFGGSYFYKVTNGATMPSFIKETGIKVSTIGNHEFDEGQEKLSQKWSRISENHQPCDFTYISANLRDSLGNTPSYAKAYITSEVKISDTKTLKISFIGLTTAATPQQTSLRHLQGLTFDADYTKVIDSLKLSTEYQAIASSIDATFVVGHIGAMRKNGIPEWEDISNKHLSKITTSTANGFFAGHTHDTLSGFINNNQLPIVQGGSNGKYIGVMKVKYDTVKNQVTQVIPELCPVRNHPSTSSYTQKLVDSLLANTYVSNHPLNENLCHIDTEMPHNRLQRYGFSEVADIVCSAYSDAYTQLVDDKCPIIGVSHFGSIRAALYKGTLSVLEAGEILPFANQLRAYQYNGKQLKKLLTFGLHNMKFGWLQTNALTFECNSKDDLEVTKVWYTSPNGNTIEIKDHNLCIIVVDDYMITGGDGYLPEFFPAQQELKVELPTTTSAFFNYLKAKDSFMSNPDAMKKVIIDDKSFRTLNEIKTNN